MIKREVCVNWANNFDKNCGVTKFNLNKHQYLLFRNFINCKVSHDLLLSYQKVLSAQKKW